MTDTLLDGDDVIDGEIRRLRRCREAWRLVRVYLNPWRTAALERVLSACGDRGTAARFLITPLPACGGLSPIELVETEDGAERLQSLIQVSVDPLTGRHTTMFGPARRPQIVLGKLRNGSPTRAM